MRSVQNDDRIEPAYLGDERTVLTGFLDFHRATLERKCAGLDADQMARRSVTPSTMSLLGLVRHLADVERGWFRRVVAGQDAPRMFYSDEDPDGDFDNVTGDDALVAQAWTAWRGEVEFARRLVADAPDLDVVGHHPRDGAVSLRGVVVHMLEEYARHNGHADLLRQVIDGEVGE